MGNDDLDRRKGERVPVNREFAALDDADEPAIYVSDLSAGGVFVHTRDRLELGATVELRFTVLLDDPVVIETLAKVVRHQDDPPGMGVEFVAMRADMSLRVSDCIARQRPLDSGTPLSQLEPRPRGKTKPLGSKDHRKQREVSEDAATASFPRVPPEQRKRGRRRRVSNVRVRRVSDEQATAVYSKVDSE